MYNKFLVLLCLLFIFSAQSTPQIQIEHGVTLDGFAQIKITNSTTKDLACYVAIDGYKIKFVLHRRAQSKWYKTTDKRFSYDSFSTWCDYIDFYPEYRKYQDN